MKVTGILVFLGITAVASATSITVNFSFDAQTVGTTPVAAVAVGGGSAAIQTYMQNVLNAAGCTGCTVTVLTGATGNGTNQAGAVTDQHYNGDNNVTGPGTTSAPQSLTLGDSNHATASNATASGVNTPSSTYDNFIANTNDSSSQISQQITIQFSGFTGLGLTVNSFDYEIFPDASCTSLTVSSKCGGTGSNYPNQPDLIFEAGNNSNGKDTAVQTFYGVTPNTTDGTATKAPCSTLGTGGTGDCDGATSNDSTVNSPQAIGVWSGSLTNVKELDFIDWPATIGIDNLSISWTAQSGGAVPEPVSVILLGTAIAGLALRKKFRKA